jgi:hypothetical protein
LIGSSDIQVSEEDAQAGFRLLLLRHRHCLIIIHEKQQFNKGIPYLDVYDHQLDISKHSSLDGVLVQSFYPTIDVAILHVPTKSRLGEEKHCHNLTSDGVETRHARPTNTLFLSVMAAA